MRLRIAALALAALVLSPPLAHAAAAGPDLPFWPPPNPRDPAFCITTIDHPDNGFGVCVNREDLTCAVAIVRITIRGAEVICLVPPSYRAD
jgi:hypothetical protein